MWEMVLGAVIMMVGVFVGLVVAQTMYDTAAKSMQKDNSTKIM